VRASAVVGLAEIDPAGKYAFGSEGIYSQEDPRGEPDIFYDLSGGKVYLVVNGKRDLIASYYKTPQGWVWEYATKREKFPDKFRITFSLIGFYIGDLSGQGDHGYFNRRRVIPFSRPRGMPDWLQ
jgi:hypothetical protein